MVAALSCYQCLCRFGVQLSAFWHEIHLGNLSKVHGVIFFLSVTESWQVRDQSAGSLLMSVANFSTPLHNPYLFSREGLHKD